MSDDSGNPLDALAEEFVARFRRGDRPALTEFTNRHPELADEIRELFPALVMMEEVRPNADTTEAFDFRGAQIYAGQRLERLGDYRILREVGRGGMGIVYEAEQESLGRRIALKVLPPQSMLDPRHLQRFQREARAAGRLHHTNIVPVFGVGDDGGLNYYVMQFIHGLGLDQVIDELRRLRGGLPSEPQVAGSASASQIAESLISGEFPGESTVVAEPEAFGVRSPSDDDSNSGPNLLSPETTSLSQLGSQYWQSVARIGVQVADALDYASGQGVLHRDIKPSNLLLDTRGTVWVTDFGLAKATDSDNLTHTGDIVGTLKYLPPERLAGRSDQRSDIYGLGVTLYELLTQRTPFQDHDRARLVRRIAEEEPPSPRKIDPLVPRDLETIVLKAMAKDPARRYQSAADLAADLRSYLGRKPIKARRVMPWQRAWMWAERNPVAARLVAALAMVVVFSLGGAGWLRESSQRTQAINLVDSLLSADTGDFPKLLPSLAPLRRHAMPILKQRQAATDANSRAWLHATLALATVDDSQRNALINHVPQATAPEIRVLRQVLLEDRQFKGDLSSSQSAMKILWKRLASPDTKPAELLRIVAFGGELPADESGETPLPTDVAARIAEQVLHESPVVLGDWVAALRPVGGQLAPHLERILRDQHRRDAERDIAAALLAEYVTDMDQAIDLLGDSSVNRFPRFFAHLANHSDLARTILRQRLNRPVSVPWPDTVPPSASFRAPAVQAEIEAAQGWLRDRYAFVQTLPVARFAAVDAALTAAGYAVQRLRPYATRDAVQVAAIWWRDGSIAQSVIEVSVDELRARDAALRQDGFEPRDISLHHRDDGRVAYSAVWSKARDLTNVLGGNRLFPGAGDSLETLYVAHPDDDKYVPLRLQMDNRRALPIAQAIVNRDEHGPFTAIWYRPSVPFRETGYDEFTSSEAYRNTLRADRMQLDVASRRNPASPNELLYSFLWIDSAIGESKVIHEVDPAEQLTRGRDLDEQQFRPSSISVTALENGRLASAVIWYRPRHTDEELDKFAVRQANWLAALAKLGEPEPLWPQLVAADDRTLRGLLIESIAPLVADPGLVWQRLESESDDSVRRALILALGQFNPQEIDPAKRSAWIERLLKLFRDDPDSGVHGAVEWLLRSRWNEANAVARVEAELRGLPPGDLKRNWFISKSGLAFTIIRGPVEFRIGATHLEPAREYGEVPFRCRIERSYALATKELTMADLFRFRRQTYETDTAPTMDCPTTNFSWFHAASFCRWLSEQEDFAESEMCLPSLDDIDAGMFTPEGVKLPDGYLSRKGYRLPTDAEWEYACRAGSTTPRPFGRTPLLMPHYAWFKVNADNRTWPVGRLKPNDFGFFDMLGNAAEFCADPSRGAIEPPVGQTISDDDRHFWPQSPRVAQRDVRYVLRGDLYGSHESTMRSARRQGIQPTEQWSAVTVRIARTLE